MVFYESSKLISRTAVGQRASGIQVGNQHFFVRTKYLGGFTHKMYPAHHNDLCIRFGSPLSQCQTVSNEVCYFLYFVCLVVVAQDYGIFFTTQSFDLRFQVKRFFYGFIHITLFQPFFFLHY